VYRISSRELRPTPTPLFFSFLLTYLRVREGRICGAYLGTYSQNTRKISESVNVAEYLQIWKLRIHKRVVVFVLVTAAESICNLTNYITDSRTYRKRCWSKHLQHVIGYCCFLEYSIIFHLWRKWWFFSII
jgi:hypothetical protein